MNTNVDNLFMHSPIYIYGRCFYNKLLFYFPLFATFPKLNVDLPQKEDKLQIRIDLEIQTQLWAAIRIRNPI